ncbi:MAG: SGNH/GDSL hydrolase family protein [Elusimicrobiota bacterium]
MTFRYKLSLIIFGIVLGLLLLETAAQLIKGTPPPLDTDKTFATYTYVDIYKDFFKLDRSKGMYRNARWRSKPSEFPDFKRFNEKRVFIIGESVAFYFQDQFLLEKLKIIAPQYDWKVINCGMSSYDSYRIGIVFKEIVKYEPDLVIIMNGNNVGLVNPVKINHWIYKYRVLARFWVTRAVTNFLNPPVSLKKAELDELFRKNMSEIAAAAKKRGIPLALFTLPLNHHLPVEMTAYENHEFFSALWLIDKNPKKAIELFEKIRTPENRYCWFLARSYEKLGQPLKAEQYYRENIDKLHYEVNEIIREIAEGDPSVLVVDYAKYVLEKTRDNPGFEVFFDECHFWPILNYPVAEQIIECVYGHNLKFNTSILFKPQEADFEKFKSTLTDWNGLLKDNMKLIETQKEYCFYQFIHELTKPSWDRNVNSNQICGYYYKFIPNFFEDFINYAPKSLDNMDYALSRVGETLKEHNNYEKARFYFSKSIAQNPELALTYMFRGLCYYDMGNKEIADMDFATLKMKDNRFEWLNSAYLDSLLK